MIFGIRDPAVPITAIVLGLTTAMLKLILNYSRRRHMFALYHRERMAAIEKGIELPALPEDFFNEDSKLPSRGGHGTLLTGLILVFGGLTLALALHFTESRTDDNGEAALYGLIPASIGAACLVYYFTVGRKLAAAVEEEWKARLADAARLRNPPA